MIEALPREHRPSDRSTETRQRLLDAALELFGTLGFEGTTTRQLAERARVNLAAIPYHFGSKEKLYLAAANHIVDLIRERTGFVESEIDRRQGTPLSQAEARQVLHRILDRFTEIMTGPEGERWARFVLREQMEPTAAFAQIYNGFIAPLHNRFCSLICSATGRDDPSSIDLIIQGLTLSGQVLVFRFARASALQRLNADAIGDPERAAIKRVLHFNLDAILDAGGVA